MTKELVKRYQCFGCGHIFDNEKQLINNCPVCDDVDIHPLNQRADQERWDDNGGASSSE